MKRTRLAKPVIMPVRNIIFKPYRHKRHVLPLFRLRVLGVLLWRDIPRNSSLKRLLLLLPNLVLWKFRIAPRSEGCLCVSVCTCFRLELFCSHTRARTLSIDIDIDNIRGGHRRTRHVDIRHTERWRARFSTTRRKLTIQVPNPADDDLFCRTRASSVAQNT